MFCTRYALIRNSQVAYTVLIVPITAVQLSKWLGHGIPFEAVISWLVAPSCGRFHLMNSYPEFSVAVFLLNGAVNVILFCASRILKLDSAADRQADTSGSENALNDIFDASLYNSDPAPIRSSVEEPTPHEKAILASRPVQSSGSHPHMLEYRPEPVDVPSDVQDGRSSVDILFGDEITSLHEVQLSARAVDRR